MIPSAVPSIIIEVPTSPTDIPTVTPTNKSIPTQILTQTPTHTSTTAPLPPTPVPTSTEDLFADRLLPDLQTRPPTELRLLYNPNSGRALIRFTNSIWNSGPGSLELIGIPNLAQEQIRVVQRVFSSDPEIFDEYDVGEFIFHDQHHHWHLEQFAVYEVWSVDEAGYLKALVSSGSKVSWCVMDEYRTENELADEVVSKRPIYTNCEGDIQGLSVGWIDVYEYYLPGQWVEVNPLEDGLYALVSTVDPDHLLYEENIHNNAAMTYFAIRELRLEPLEDQFFVDGGVLGPNSNFTP